MGSIKNIKGKVLFSYDSEDDLVEKIKNESNKGTSFVGAIFGIVKINGLQLSHGYFAQANFNVTVINKSKITYSKFIFADFSLSYISNSDLSGCDFNNSYFSGCRFENVKLDECKFLFSNLERSVLDNCSLIGAEYSISNMLKLYWGELSDNMTLELMRHEAEYHGQYNKRKWLNDDIPRNFHFKECRELWSPGLPQYRGKELLAKLFDEKGIKHSL